MGIFDSEKLGRRVRQVWMEWARQQPDVSERPDWLDPWEKLPPRIQEVDKRIGTVIAGDVFAELQSEHASYQLRIADLEGALREYAKGHMIYCGSSLHNNIPGKCTCPYGKAKQLLTPEGGGK